VKASNFLLTFGFVTCFVLQDWFVWILVYDSLFIDFVACGLEAKQLGPQFYWSFSEFGARNQVCSL
jgi:hypothetical protein